MYKLKQNFDKRPLFILFLVLTISAVLLFANHNAKAGAPDQTTIGFSTYLGGSSEECLFERCVIAVDQDGYIYVAGTTRSSDFPLQAPIALDDDNDGSGNDIFVAKLMPNGSLLFSTYIGNGAAQGITVDEDGNVYVTGYTNDDDFPTTSDAYATCAGNLIDTVVFKLSADGTSLDYSSCIGGSGRDEGYEIALDSNNQMIVVGFTQSDDFPTKNAIQTNHGGSEDITIFKLSTNGTTSTLHHSSYLGGAKRDYGWAVEIDDTDNIYIGGRSDSDDFPTTAGVLQEDRFSNAGTDGIVAKLDSSGGLVYSTFYNDTSSNAVADIAVDDGGHVYFVTIAEEAVKLNATASQINYLADLDIYIAVEGEGRIVLDSENNAFIVGRSQSTHADLVLTAVHHSGHVVYRETIGGSDAEQGMGLALYEHNDEIEATLIGTTESSDFPTMNPIQASLNGSTDAVVVNIEGLETAVQFHQNFLPLVVK